VDDLIDRAAPRPLGTRHRSVVATSAAPGFHWPAAEFPDPDSKYLPIPRVSSP
jgi:hypothetical protein